MSLETTITQLRAWAHAQNLILQDERVIDYGQQFKLTRGDETVIVNIYRTGKILVQGKASELKAQIELWAGAKQPVVSPQAHTNRIGMDESGKGDYFGSLVVAAVYVEAATEPKLVSLGVRDSKALTENRILELENAIKILCPHAVVEFAPPRYNQLYAELHNLNKVLAQGHAQALEDVLNKVSCEVAVADQFGDEKYIRQALLEKGKKIKVEQRPKAESDVAVAAASILARARFVQSLAALRKLIGLDLPKGASDPRIVELRQTLLATHGLQILDRLAKTHFNL